jgi:hypothetical protein
MENGNMQNPQVSQESGSRNFFLYLVVYFSLSFLSFGSGSILFQAINKFLPDSVSGTFDQGPIRFGIASLFIAGPIFFLVSRLIVKKINSGEIALQSVIRKWLTYIVLFLAAATVIGDLITLMFNFLNGDTTIQFFLKVLVVLFIAGSIFSYYFWEMQKTVLDESEKKLHKYIAITSITFVVALFVFSFFVIDSPSVARAKRIDQQTISNVQAIDSSVRNFFTQSGKLPTSVDDLTKTGFAPYLQGENNVEYLVENESTFKLCATFMRSDNNDKDYTFSMMSAGEWKHGQGRVCFDRIALNDNAGKIPVNVQ